MNIDGTGINGLALYDTVRAAQNRGTIRAILVSADIPKKETAKRTLIGIEKPFDLNELLEAIERVLRNTPAL